MGSDPVWAALGLLLVFVAPGLGIGAAVFPEKLRRGNGWLGPVELAVLAVVGSVAVTILLGSVLLASSVGFGVNANNPSLWVGDGLVALAGGCVWYLRRNTPAPAGPEGEAGEDEGWRRLRTLERIARDERTTRRALRSADLRGSEREALEDRLRRLKGEREALKRSAEPGHAA